MKLLVIVPVFLVALLFKGDTNLKEFMIASLPLLVVDGSYEILGFFAFGCVVFGLGKLGLVLKGGYILELQLVIEENGRGINALYYFQWELDTTTVQPFTSNQITHSLLLLPCLKEPKRVGLYAVITSRWEEMRADGTLGLPPHIDAKERVVEL